MKRNASPINKAAKKSASSGHWANGLLAAMKDPDLLVKEDNLVAVIKDKYPKAEFHYLILCKEDLSSLKAIKTQHLSLLKHMQKVAKEVAAKHEEKVFKFGYHAQASMARLHLHAISDDFASNCLKTKKHWNTFTTDFFLDSYVNTRKTRILLSCRME